MKNMNIPALGMITLRRNNKKEKLKTKLEFLIKDLQEELKMLEKYPDHKPNSLGIIQHRGHEIDLLCAELYTLNDTIEMLDTEKKSK